MARHHRSARAFGLFALPTALEGAGSIMDFGNSLQGYRTQRTEAAADSVAIASDWWAVGDDLESAAAYHVAE